MFFNPKLNLSTEGEFTFGKEVAIKAGSCINKPIFKEIWNGFCCGAGNLSVEEISDLTICVGEAPVIKKPKNGYVMEITEKGISACASDEKNLIYAFYTLLEKIRPVCLDSGKERFAVACGKVADEGFVKTRMVHFCVFPETKLDFVRKFLRTAAFLRYTHIIVEFWGTLKFDCLKELAWNEAFSKDQIKPLFCEARDMGIEIVPMFNHWGHASASRLNQGKHVVLDQNLKLAPLFDISGWNWNLENPAVCALHAKIRDELIELCGNGQYFVIGCDEAYGEITEKYCRTVIDYINNVSADLRKAGRKTIMWGDMLLHKESFNAKTDNNYIFSCPDIKIQKLLFEKLSKDIIIGDWQYNAKSYPIETSVFLKERGFEVLCCPWDRTVENLIAVAKTVKQNALKGVLHTTWHNLGMGIHCFSIIAKLCWEEDATHIDTKYNKAYLASVMRKLDIPNGDYVSSGWAAQQVQDYLF